MVYLITLKYSGVQYLFVTRLPYGPRCFSKIYAEEYSLCPFWKTGTRPVASLYNCLQTAQEVLPMFSSKAVMWKKLCG